MRQLSRADKVECVRFFPVIISHIFKVMCDNHNRVEGGTYAATDPYYKDPSSPRSRAMSDGNCLLLPFSFYLLTLPLLHPLTLPLSFSFFFQCSQHIVF
jgi:hypothetical protein